MKKPEIDKNICIGCGTCANVCPEVFELGADAKANVKQADYEDKEECVQGAIDSCPVAAISWSEEKKEKENLEK
jgi:ferredoxin